MTKVVIRRYGYAKCRTLTGDPPENWSTTPKPYIPSRISDDDKANAEQILVDAAEVIEPAQIARLGKEILAHLDPDGPEPKDDNPARPRRFLRLRERVGRRRTRPRSRHPAQHRARTTGPTAQCGSQRRCPRHPHARPTQRRRICGSAQATTTQPTAISRLTTLPT